MSNLWPTFTMMVGLPGSGKSTYAKEHAENVIIVSTDDIREELFGSADDNINTKENNHKVFETAHRYIRSYLKCGENVIFDATTISSKRRIALLRELHNIYCNKNCIIIATPYRQCLINNQLRDRNVPTSVIKHMYMNWYTPHKFEGWDDIQLEYYPDASYLYDAEEFLHQSAFFNQKNHHHALSLGVHSMLVGDYNYAFPLLRYAGYLHDVGKPFTMTFQDYNGNHTNDAHYYQHHCVGAYDTLFFKLQSYFIDTIEVSALINYHMYPYFWEKDPNGEKVRNKYLKLWGKDFFDNVMRLHKADVAAH